MKRKSWYTRFSRTAARVTGRPLAFVAGVLVILVTGPLSGFSEEWQVVVQTVTAVVTFLMVFIIQNTQNRDTEAIQIKLDELIRATEGAHLVLLDLEELDEEELDEFRSRYEKLAAKARRDIAKGRPDTDNRAI